MLWETSENDTIQMVVARTEAKAQSWEHEIHASGGSLNLLKSFWYAISWKWRKNGQPVMQMKPDDPELEIRMTQGADRNNAKAVKCIEVTEGKRTLGLCLTPLRTDKTEYDHHVEEAKKTRSRLL